jgi:hypothetical protein
MGNERVKPCSQSAAAVEWRIIDRDRIVIRYEFASRRWFGEVEPFDDQTGRFGEASELAPEQIETLQRFFDFVLADGRQPSETRVQPKSAQPKK